MIVIAIVIIITIIMIIVFILNFCTQTLLNEGKKLLQGRTLDDRKRGFHSLEEAEKLGSSEARGLMSIYLTIGGLEYGVGESEEENLARGRKLAEKGLRELPPDPKCEAAFGKLELLRGQDGRQQGLTVLRNAIKRNPNEAWSLCFLGEGYLQAKRLDRQYEEKVINCLQRAVDLGLPRAMLQLANFCKDKKKQREPERAKKLYQQAADLGCPTSMLNLAGIMMYESDIDSARKMFQSASELGDSDARYALDTNELSLNGTGKLSYEEFVERKNPAYSQSTELSSDDSDDTESNSDGSESSG
jgi:TPR repeat protein